MFSKRSSRNGSKLSLNRSTVRALSGSALASAAGGVIKDFTQNDTDLCPFTGVPPATDGCPQNPTTVCPFSAVCL